MPGRNRWHRLEQEVSKWDSKTWCGGGLSTVAIPWRQMGNDQGLGTLETARAYTLETAWARCRDGDVAEGFAAGGPDAGEEPGIHRDCRAHVGVGNRRECDDV